MAYAIFVMLPSIFVIDHDPKKHFKFASLQSDFGYEVLKSMVEILQILIQLFC